MTLLHTPVEVSLKNILVATDFSPVSVSALKCVLPIARESGSVVHIVHVIHPPEIEIASPAAIADVSGEIYAEAREELHQLEAVVESVPHQTCLREGKVWAVVEDIVRSEHIDLIVVGTSGKSNVKKFFLGSVAEEIFRNATCPVLTAGPHASAADRGASLAQILYVTNLFEESHYGLRYAISLAVQHKSQLMLLHVIEQEDRKPFDHEWLRAYRRILHNLLPESADDLPVEPVLRIEIAKNSPARILQVADEIRADLMVMDVRPEEPWAAHLRDKVYEIISWANCPVLTVRTSPEAAP